MARTIRLGIFPAASEGLLLIYPLAFLALSLVGLWLGPDFSKHPPFLLGLLRFALVFDFTHIFLTPVALTDLSGLREWRRSSDQRRGWSLWFGAAAVFLLGFLVRYAHISSRQDTFFAFLLFSGMSLYRTHHNLMQYKGLSFCYNGRARSGGLSESQSLLLRAAERRETLCFTALLLPVTFLNSIVYYETFFPKHETIAWLPVAMRATAVSVAVLALGLVVNARKIPGLPATNKRIYLLRIFQYSLVGTSFWNRVGVLSTHGLEYFQLLFHLSRSPAERGRSWIYWRIVAIVLVIDFALVLLIQGNSFTGQGREGKATVLVFAFAALQAGCTFAHYYLDRQIFRMKDPETARALLPMMYYSDSKA